MSRKKNVRRGKRKRENELLEKLVIAGTNANGIKSKKESFIHWLENDNPQVVMVQETKVTRKNQFNVPGYEFFEKPRIGKGGGGVMIGVRKDIDGVPVVVSNHDEDVEILVIEIVLKAMTIRFLTGYGLQEGAPEDEINKFYAAFEEEVIRCEQDGCGLIAELDFNAKLGMEIIKGDPNPMSVNGRLMWEIVQRQECTVVNATELCKGTLTRSRMKKDIKEESVLDYVIVNARIQPFLQQMEIDEAKAKALARFQKGRAVTSDHNTLTCTFNIPVDKKPPPRTEVYRLRNEEELIQYREKTTHTDKFTRCFTKDGDIAEEGKKWMKEVNKTIKSCFKKIRIRPNHKRKQSDGQKKLEERKNILKRLSSTNSKREKHELEDELSKIEQDISEEHREKLINIINVQLLYYRKLISLMQST